MHSGGLRQRPRPKTYKYDDAGERVIKRGPQGETAYINQFFTMRNREVGTKHVFAGGTRLVSKLVKAPNVVDLDGDGIPDDMPNACSEPWGWTNGNGGQGNANGICNGKAGGNGNGNGGSGPEVFEKDQYYYHPDHLGSSSYVTDLDGEIFQHLEYFPFGEIFYSLRETQIVIERWRRHYNTKRPHSALGYRPPAPETIIPMDRRPVMH